MRKIVARGEILTYYKHRWGGGFHFGWEEEKKYGFKGTVSPV
jgi:hypothetical protein